MQKIILKELITFQFLEKSEWQLLLRTRGLIIPKKIKSTKASIKEFSEVYCNAELYPLIKSTIQNKQQIRIWLHNLQNKNLYIGIVRNLFIESKNLKISCYNTLL